MTALLHVRHRILAYGLLDEIDSVGIQSSQIADGLVYLPGAVGVQADFPLVPDSFTNCTNHFHFGFNIDPYFEIKNVKPLVKAVTTLFGKLRGRPLRQIVKVVDPFPHLATQ